MQFSIIDTMQGRDVLLEGYEPPLSDSERAHLRQFVTRKEARRPRARRPHVGRISGGNVMTYHPHRFTGPRQLTPLGRMVVTALLCLALVVVASYGPEVML